MVDVNVHGSMQGGDQGGLVCSQSLMSSVDGLGLPVGPVDVLLKQRHGKDVRNVLVKNCEKHNIKPSFSYKTTHKVSIFQCLRFINRKGRTFSKTS